MRKFLPATLAIAGLAFSLLAMPASAALMLSNGSRLSNGLMLSNSADAGALSLEGVILPRAE